MSSRDVGIAIVAGLSFAVYTMFLGDDLSQQLAEALFMWWPGAFVLLLVSLLLGVRANMPGAGLTGALGVAWLSFLGTTLVLGVAIWFQPRGP